MIRAHLISTLALCSMLFMALPARAQQGPCSDKCLKKQQRCDGLWQKQQGKCMSQAETWKAKAEKRAAKAKNPGKAQAKVQARYDKMKQTCEKRRAKAAARCSRDNERCGKACLAKAKKPAGKGKGIKSTPKKTPPRKG